LRLRNIFFIHRFFSELETAFPALQIFFGLKFFSWLTEFFSTS
jgi:hypothetical protein